MKKRLFPVALTLALAALTPLGILPRKHQLQQRDEARAATTEAVPAIALVQPSPAPAERVLRLPGSLEARQESPIFARTNGFVKARFVDIGDHVVQGQPLAELEAPEQEDALAQAQADVTRAGADVNGAGADVERAEAAVSQARADLQAARAEVSQARADLASRQSEADFALKSNHRWQKLLEDGAVPQQEADQRVSQHLAAQAGVRAAQDRIRAAQSRVVSTEARIQALRSEVSAARARVGSAQATVGARQAAARRVETEMSFRTLRAPFTGIITERNVDVGSLITSGSENSKKPLFRIGQIESLRLFVEVPQSSVGSVTPGSRAEATVAQLPGRTFTGKVVRISQALDPISRTMRIEIAMANPRHELAPGMHADVTLKVRRQSPAWLVPSSSVVMKGSAPQLVSVDGAKTAHFRTIQVGMDMGKQVEVVTGLKGDEKIVLSPLDTLREGNSVP